MGMPVSWQMAPSSSAAWSMLTAMIVSACSDRVSGGLDVRAPPSWRRARRAEDRSTS
ncbi:MAG: hypothetical protein M0C28_13485 [Candidatus Moduliflexus flocculans]|nr:hypothetical protein [Candidatus Moduliflexus flocculans]